MLKPPDRSGGRSFFDLINSNPAGRDFLSFDWLKNTTQIDSEDWLTPLGVRRFLTEVVEWRPDEEPADYQIEIAEMLMEYRRVAVRGPHGIGKTALSALLVWFFMFAVPNDLKVITTASAWRQLIHFLWPEIHSWRTRVDWQKYGLMARLDKEVLAQNIQMPGNKYAFAVASNQPELVEGAHAKTLLYILDEAKAIPEALWDAIEGALSTGNCYAFSISTPGDPAGRFYDIFQRKPGLEDWKTRHVTLAEAITAGRISAEWAEQRRKQWQVSNPQMYENRVLGNFYASSTRSVIPLAWVEAAIERWYALRDAGEFEKNRHIVPSYGLDVAEGTGDDSSALAVLRMNWIESVTYYDNIDVMQLTGEVVNAMRSFPEAIVGVDTIGVGVGPFRRLRELGIKATSIKASEKCEFKDQSNQLEFANLRAGMWWTLRDRLDPYRGPRSPESLALPPDDRLISDLTIPMYETQSNGKILIEPKEEIRARLGRSPDGADAVLLSLFAKRKGRPLLMV